MPELPEVETVRRIIGPLIEGKTITEVRIPNSQVIATPAEDFAERLPGSTIEAVSRRGKFLNIHLDTGDRLTLHLRMTGELTVSRALEPLEKHTHVVFELSDGNELRYTDVRRFGRFWLLKKDEPDRITGQEKLGPEPDDPVLTGEYLESRMGKRKKAVKEMLLDQTMIAGIGNIYSDEILFAAGIYPADPCASLSPTDWENLARTIPEIIQWGIETDALTPEEYLEGKGREYRNESSFRIYGREGLPCVRCGTPVLKIRVGGRSSHYCPVCQRKREQL